MKIIPGALLAITAAAPAQMQSGLIAHWRLHGDAVDASGNGHDGANQGAQPASDRFGQPQACFGFSGQSEISVPDDPAFTLGTRPFTIAVWLTLDADGAHYVMGHDDGAGEFNKWILWADRFAGGTGWLRFHVNSPTAAGYNPVFFQAWTPAIGAWYHVAVRRSGAQYELFIDGQSVAMGSDARAIPDPGAPLLLGNAEASGRRLRGKLDDVRLYDRALTDPEIRQLASLGNAEGYGVGLAGSGGSVPQIAALSAAFVGTSFDLGLRNCVGGAPCLLLIGAVPTNLPLFGGTLWVAPPWLIAAATLSGASGTPGVGAAVLPLPIPGGVRLIGEPIRAQAVVLDPGAVQGFSLSAGLEALVAG